MSSMSRSIRRQAQRRRLNMVARRLCPECGGVLKVNSAIVYTCKKCQKRFKSRPKKA